MYSTAIQLLRGMCIVYITYTQVYTYICVQYILYMYMYICVLYTKCTDVYSTLMPIQLYNYI